MAKKRIELVDSGVVFDEDKHTYNLNGNYLSGITGVIQNSFSRMSLTIFQLKF